MSQVQSQFLPVHAKYASEPQYPKHTSVVKQRPMSTLAVDPVLLYAKLEVAKLEQDAVRKAYKERKQQRAAKEERDAARRASLQESRAHLRESLRRSMPIEAEFTADGKPCFNTATLLAALDTSPPLRHGSMRKSGLMRDTSRVKDDSSPSGTENDVVETLGKRRRFKLQEGPFKLVPIKHGSQTTYERVDLPVETGLIDDTPSDGEEHKTRPRLSKHDRPHWAQQSQNPTQMRKLKSTIQSMTQPRTKRPEVPAIPPDAAKVVRKSSFSQLQSGHLSDTLIADAVNQIKKEQRAKKLHTVSSLFKKPPCS